MLKNQKYVNTIVVTFKLRIFEKLATYIDYFT